MKKVEDKEAKKINGGINLIAVTVITTAVIFLTGVFSGIVNPNRCDIS